MKYLLLKLKKKAVKEAAVAFKLLSSEIKSVDGEKLLEFLLKELAEDPAWIINQLYEGSIEDMLECEQDELLKMGVVVKADQEL